MPQRPGTLASLQIRKKLLLLVIFIFVSAGAAVVLVGMKHGSESIAMAKKEISFLVESMAAQQERIANGTKHLLGTLARFPAVQSLDADACNTFFREVSLENPFYSFIGAATANGRVFAGSSDFEPGSVDVSDRKDFRDAVRTLDFSVGESILGRISQVSSIEFCYPVLDSNGNLAAVLIADFSSDVYAGFLSGMSLPEDGIVTVTDHRGVRLFGYPDHDEIGPGSPIADDLYRFISGKSGRGIVEAAGAEGKKRIYAFKQLSLNGEAVPYLYMIVGVPKHLIILKAAIKTLGNLLILGAVGLIAFFLTWVFGNSMMTAPIKRLVMAAKRLGEGELGARTDLPHTADELGRLAEAFDHMASLLEKRKEALESAYSEMEQRVQERTIELSTSNIALRVEILERERAESALKESQQQLSQIFDFLPDPTFAIDLSGKVIAWNKAIEDITGVKAEGILGKGDYEYGLAFYGTRRPILIDLVFRSYEETEDKYFFIKKEGDILLSETDVLLKGREKRSLAGKARPLYDSAGRVVGAIESIRDITILKKTQKMLRDSEERYRSVVENIQDTFYRTDKNGVITMVSPSATRLYGAPLDEILGRHVESFWKSPDERGAFLQRLEQDGVVRDYEVTVLRKDGSPIFTSVTSILREDRNGNILGVEGLIRDITERKSAEEERSRLQTAIEQVAEGIIITRENWVIQYANSAFERITGYGRGEIIGRHASVMLSERHDANFYKRLRKGLLSGDGWIGRLVCKKKNGALYDAEVTASAVRDKSGEIMNYLCIHRDVTREVELERDLYQAQKMEAIGKLAGGIAHDFNNILGAIIGFTELSLLRVPEKDPVHGNLERVLQAASRASGVVRQILTFSRNGERERKPVQIVPIVREALSLLRSSLPSTIRIKQDLEIEPGNGTVLADPTQIHQVMMNLCTNAAHSMQAKGGTLSVKISEIEDTSRKPGHPDLDGGPYVSISVSDTGAGMNKEIMERIFDPYFTTKAPGEGTGLGLTVVQGIVRNHEGKITVNSEPGQGTTFHIFLPKIVEQALEEMEEAEQTSLTGCGRILFVDDEQALADLGKEMLESLGYHVTALTNSRYALETFSAGPDKFDLVITDMTMPDLTGRDLARKLMEIRADIPVVLCTGFSNQINANQSEVDGISDFVMKPYVCATLASTIRKVLNNNGVSAEH